MIADIQSRLRDAPGTPFALVSGAVDLAQVRDHPPALPAAFVVILREASSDNERATGPILQRTAADIGVVLVFEHLGSPLGDPAADALETLRGWVRRHLVGFLPADAADPLEHVEGELVKARGGTVWWQETFGTAYFSQEA